MLSWGSPMKVCCSQMEQILSATPAWMFIVWPGCQPLHNYFMCGIWSLLVLRADIASVPVLFLLIFASRSFQTTCHFILAFDWPSTRGNSVCKSWKWLKSRLKAVKGSNWAKESVRSTKHQTWMGETAGNVSADQRHLRLQEQWSKATSNFQFGFWFSILAAHCS